ncbi:MAG: helix-turn-helix domain-containing protein [Sphingomonadales bacterium]|nr:helix-turn-helix domain-containing protein [Sphingomonadales bacterium]MDE2171195.1 helix-turn-helix domain-containing protein [Sphingomonadales bacterium]
MSIETSAWAKRQRTGSPANRAVLVELANWANPDGEVQFRRIADIAQACEMSERQAQRIIKKLETRAEDGGLELIVRVCVFSDKGAQKANAFRLVGYKREGDNMSPPQGDKMTPPGVTKRHRGGDMDVTGGGDTDVTPYKELDLEPYTPPTPPRGRKSRFPLPDDWQAPALADLPEAAQLAAAAWPAGAYAAQAEAFGAYHRGKGSVAADWNALWVAWIAKNHAEVMRNAGKAAAYTGPRLVSTAPHAKALARPASRPTPAKAREDDRSAALHQSLREILGDLAWERWFAPAALLFTDPGLTVVAGTQTQRERIESDYAGRIAQALDTLGWGRDWVRFDVQAQRQSRASP